MTNIAFNSNSLQTTSIITSEIDHHSSPNKAVAQASIAHGNKSRIIYTEYKDKKINITGQLVSTTITTLDALIDTFKGYLQGEDKNLDIEYNGTTRRYVATENVTQIERPGGLLFANFKVQFICAFPFGTDLASSSLSTQTTQTNAIYNYAITVAGSAPWQCPVITVTYSAITGLTSKTVSIGNGNTGQIISVTRTWTATDVLEVDVANRTVKVNGVQVEFSGAFPEFQPGSGTLSYADDFTTRTFGLTATYYKRYV